MDQTQTRRLHWESELTNLFTGVMKDYSGYKMNDRIRTFQAFVHNVCQTKHSSSFFHAACGFPHVGPFENSIVDEFHRIDKHFARRLGKF